MFLWYKLGLSNVLVCLPTPSVTTIARFKKMVPTPKRLKSTYFLFLNLLELGLSKRPRGQGLIVGILRKLIRASRPKKSVILL